MTMASAEETLALHWLLLAQPRSHVTALACERSRARRTSQCPEPKAEPEPPPVAPACEKPIWVAVQSSPPPADLPCAEIWPVKREPAHRERRQYLEMRGVQVASWHQPQSASSCAALAIVLCQCSGCKEGRGRRSPAGTVSCAKITGSVVAPCSGSIKNTAPLSELIPCRSFHEPKSMPIVLIVPSVSAGPVFHRRSGSGHFHTRFSKKDKAFVRPYHPDRW